MRIRDIREGARGGFFPTRKKIYLHGGRGDRSGARVKTQRACTVRVRGATISKVVGNGGRTRGSHWCGAFCSIGRGGWHSRARRGDAQGRREDPSTRMAGRAARPARPRVVKRRGKCQGNLNSTPQKESRIKSGFFQTHPIQQVTST